MEKVGKEGELSQPIYVAFTLINFSNFDVLYGCVFQPALGCSSYTDISYHDRMGNSLEV